MTNNSINDKLIVAIDVEDVDTARQLISTLNGVVTFYKIGLELAYNGGLDLARDLKASGNRVFIDLKLHDIGTTVERATRQIAKMGMDFLTVHAYPQTMEAARNGAGNDLKLLAVTVMTSYSDVDLAAAGYKVGVQNLVTKRVLQAKNHSIDGVIISPLELDTVRPIVGKDMLLVTPGIRPAGSETGDQKRITTPAEAVRDSANHIVVGRPITRAADPRAVAEKIITEISGV